MFYCVIDVLLDYWECECVLLSGLFGVDVLLIEYGGCWWMFYILVGLGVWD